jgi:hypothetical protein
LQDLTLEWLPNNIFDSVPEPTQKSANETNRKRKRSFSDANSERIKRRKLSADGNEHIIESRIDNVPKEKSEEVDVPPVHVPKKRGRPKKIEEH